ncbi:MAG TPA: DNA internalization-related competence protein ComEC/Rec2 [Candidatus Polarisedimenticolia bacterium]|nr:DNA internalization-related competence protein ComEC/Rec2 [Candidatus Polarisedimenticolia bacterium]
MRRTSPPRFTFSFGTAVAFASGIAAARVILLPPPLFILGSAICIAAAWSLRRRALAGCRQPSLALAACVSLAIATGGAALASRTHRSYQQAPLLRLAEREPLDPARLTRVRGRVISDPVLHLDRLRFSFQVEEVAVPDGWLPCPGTVRISVRAPAPAFRPAYGSRWEMPLRLRQGKSFRNPGAFDYRLALEADGIHLLGNLKSSQLAEPLPGKGYDDPMVAIHRLRSRWKARLDASFQNPDGEESRRFLAAILLGEREGGEGRTESLFRRTGVYHIVSISGMHFALLLAMLRVLGRRLPWRRWTEPALLAGVGGFYVLLSGGADPILRCALAAGLQELGERFERKVSAWDAQSLAGVALMVVTPQHLFTPAFQLSFLATWGILALGGGATPAPAKLQWAARGIKASLGAWTASTPLMACWFLQISPVALLLNIIAAPFLTISMVLGGFLLVRPGAAGAAWMEALLAGFASCCSIALRIPGACLRVPSPSFPVTAALGALLLARLHCKTRKPEGKVLYGAVLASMVLMAWPPDPWLPPGRLSVMALDVGQGDAILVGLPGPKWVLVDAGGFAASDFDVGERVVLPALMSRGVRRLEAVVLTHAHQDHGGGLPAILEAFPPREIWLGGAPADAALVRRIEAQAGSLRITELHPAGGTMRCYGAACLEVLLSGAAMSRRGGKVANDDSLVLRVSLGDTAALLTGDVEAEGEQRLIPLLASRPVQLLKVAHHGSSSSTSEAFLEAASPRIAVISVGTGNPWGHPAPSVVDRLRRGSIGIHRTDREGAIEYETAGQGWSRRALAVPP